MQKRPRYPKNCWNPVWAGFKVEQARIKGDIWQSKVFRTRKSLEHEDIVLAKFGTTVDKGMAMGKQKSRKIFRERMMTSSRWRKWRASRATQTMQIY
jgi:hypothetical protein